jgi:hypothetical protein
MSMRSTVRLALAAIAAWGAIYSSCLAAADEAFIRASRGILMSRSMDIKDRVAAADSLARYEPRAAVPILIEALNETSEPVRRAAARGLWTVAQNENAEDAAAARAAMPCAAHCAPGCQRVGGDESGGRTGEARRVARRTGRVSPRGTSDADRTPMSASSPRVA